MKRKFGKVLGAGIICLVVAGTIVLAAYSIAAKEIRNGNVLKNPVTIEGKVVSRNFKGRNLEVKIDSSDVPVDFLAYLPLRFGEGKYRHNFEAIQSLYKDLKKGDQVKVYGFKDPQTNTIYGSDIERLGYVSLINK